ASQDEESALKSDGRPEYTVDENTKVSANTTLSRDQAQSTASSQSVSRVTPKSRGKKRQLDDLRSAVNELENVHKNLNNQPECQISENEAFGQYITVCLNKLPVQESVMLQSEIQSLVTKYRLKAVQTSVAVNTPSEIHSQALNEEHSLTSPSNSVEDQMNGLQNRFTSCKSTNNNRPKHHRHKRLPVYSSNCSQYRNCQFGEKTKYKSEIENQSAYSKIVKSTSKRKITQSAEPAAKQLRPRINSNPTSSKNKDSKQN
ncbi:unnamed protein product, partial [Acanthoscelides obtectus]